MADVLFATLDSGGNVPPLLGVAAEVTRRGHQVRVLGHEQQRAAVEAAGLEFHPYRDSTWDPRENQSSLRGVLGFVHQFAGRDKGADVVELLRPDTVVVADCMLLNVLSAAQDAGRPTVSLVHSFHAYFDGPWRRGPIGLLAAMKGLRSRRIWSACDAVLVCTDRALDPAASSSWPDTFVWTGPVQPVTTAATPADPPRILASLSTIAYPGQQQVLQNILTGLADAPVEVVLTTGPAIEPATLDVPANAEVHRYIPHDEVMAGCTAVIGHGGHSTTVRALAHGLPLVVIPMHPMLDQPMVGKAVQAAGAGVSIKKTSSPAEIRAALDIVLDGPHRDAAAAIGARWRGVDGAVVAADTILALRPEPVSP